MNTMTEADPREEPTPVEGPGGALASFGLIHVVACIGAGVAVVLALVLVEWLT